MCLELDNYEHIQWQNSFLKMGMILTANAFWSFNHTLTYLWFFGKRSYAKELSNIQISEDIVKHKLKKLKLNKSPGPDKMHPRVCHEISDVIAVPITIIFQNSLAKKDLPQEWKHTHISAIFKKGVKTQPLNYRPVSLTSVVYKIMESIIRDNIITQMKENNLFSDK